MSGQTLSLVSNFVIRARCHTGDDVCVDFQNCSYSICNSDRTIAELALNNSHSLTHFSTYVIYGFGLPLWYLQTLLINITERLYILPRFVRNVFNTFTCQYNYKRLFFLSPIIVQYTYQRQWNVLSILMYYFHN